MQARWRAIGGGAKRDGAAEGACSVIRISPYARRHRPAALRHVAVSWVRLRR